METRSTRNKTTQERREVQEREARRSQGRQAGSINNNDLDDVSHVSNDGSGRQDSESKEYNSSMEFFERQTHLGDLYDLRFRHLRGTAYELRELEKRQTVRLVFSQLKLYRKNIWIRE